METIVCPLCKESELEVLFYKDKFRVVRCKKCSLMYINPRLTKKESHALYNKNIISPMQYYEETRHEDRITFKERLKKIEKRVRGKRMLDIGCNTGTFLGVAKEAGWGCYGVDVNKGVRKECEKKGISFFHGTLDTIKFKKNFFDVIIMNDLIEHVHDPRKLLQQARKILKQEGIIFMVTPDAESYAARFLKRRWPHLKPNEHLMYFSKRTLKKLLKEEGFTIVRMNHIGRWRRVETIVHKGRGVWGGMEMIEKIIPSKLMKVNISCKLFDELYVIAQKI